MGLPWEEGDDDDDTNDEFGDVGWPEDWAGPEYHLNKPFLGEPEKSMTDIIEEFLRTL